MGNALCGLLAPPAAAVVVAAGIAPEAAGGKAASRARRAPGHAAAVAPAAPPPPRDEIEAALAHARLELDAAGQQLARFAAEFEVGRMVGHGAFSKVQVCTRRGSQQEFAVKTVTKAPDDLKQREGIIKEVAIMRLLAGHPNVVALHGVYEDEAAYHLVLELCRGGELFDQIISRRHFSEADAVTIMRSLLDFIAFAHTKHIVHRDLKPENLLLTSACGGAQLRIIDFGASEFCKPGCRLSSRFGSCYYVAPEVLRKDYGPAADVWSAGVILYILLCGYPPFSGTSDARILQRVKEGRYTFANREWDCVTEAAKQMITEMLVLEEEQRSSAAALLHHAWFKQDPAAARPQGCGASAAALGTHMVRRLRGFAAMSHMKRLALVLLARTLTDKEVARLRALFMTMDQDNDGRIAPLDLHRALQQVGARIDEAEMVQLFTVADISGQGAIDYEEFIAAMLDANRVAQRADALRSSFEQMDRDGDGYISVEDLASVLQDERPAMKGPAGRRLSLEMAAALVAEADADCDGSVSFDDFTHMWRPAAALPPLPPLPPPVAAQH